jgi:DNA-directed RNA polymerase specialized sigma24 family protein
MEMKMEAVITGKNREALLKEIHNAFLQWPELDQKVFHQARYCGQSPEIISRSLQLEEEEVAATLQRCERRLYASLRNFRKICSDTPPLIDPDHDFGIHTLAS